MPNEPNSELHQKLATLIASDLSLQAVRDRLRQMRQAGLFRGEAQTVLEGLRRNAADEATEDRILEVLDLVSGFCAPEHRIWD